jgi:uncharacterized protein YciI
MRNSIFVLSLLITAVVFASSDTPSKEKSANAEQEKVNTSQPVTYVAAIVRMGDNWRQDSIRAFELQEKHLAFLERLRTNNQLIASGPLTTSPDARGLYIFNVSSVAEAEALVSKDEAIQAGWIQMDFHVWAARDYEVLEPVSSTEKEGSGIKLGVKGWLAAVFVLLIIVLMLRTFRGVASA